MERVAKALRTPILVSVDEEYVKWVAALESWAQTISENILARVKQERENIELVKEKYVELDNFVTEQNRKDRIAIEEAGPQMDGELRWQHHDRVNVDSSKAVTAQREQLGVAFFTDTTYSVVTSGEYRIHVTLTILPDILVPHDAMETVDVNVNVREVCWTSISIEIALGTTPFAHVSRGGHRFINEMIRRIGSNLAHGNVSLGHAIDGPVACFIGGVPDKIERSFHVLAKFQPLKPETAQHRLCGTGRDVVMARRMN